MSDLQSRLQSTLGSTYSLDRELGGGGMSRVFVAEERRLGRRVVIKVLPAEMAAGMSAERFEREIRVAAGLQHAHIVPLLSAGESDGLPYYTMPFVDGESLRARLGRGPLPISEAVGVLRDVAKALAYAHANGVVHRDIKPDNVLISGGSAVVADFGIAKAVSAARGEAEGTRAPTLTSVGTSLGTPAYMSPEQVAADPAANHLVDIYAFGCMAFEILAGRTPFLAPNPQKMLAAHLGEQPPDIRELRPDTPEVVADLVMRCLAKDADRRPQSADELARVLDLTTSGDMTPVMPRILIGGTRKIWRGLAMYAAAFVAVAILARAAVVAIGLPEWAFTGAIVVMALGLPVILATAYVHWTMHRAMTSTPTLTPGGTHEPPGTIATIAMKASPHLTWRRASIGGWLAVGGFVLLVAGYMVTRALGIGPAASLLAAGAISERDQLIVADFTVRGDSTLGGVLAEAVRTALAQSTVVTVMPTSMVMSALRRMERPPETTVGPELAREIAIREGAKAIVDGEITPVGQAYLITLRLVSADSALQLASFQGTAASALELLPTLGDLSKSLRAKLGESLKRVQATPPLAQVTTSSLPALHKYVEATRAINVEANFERALVLAREAIALDSTFAMAHRAVAISSRNSFMPRASYDSAITKAYHFRDRLTERERLVTTADYYVGPGKDRAKAIAAYEEMLQRNPRDMVALNNVALEYDTRREFARAESLYHRAIDADSTSVIAHGNLVHAFINQGKYSEAEAALAAVPSRSADHPLVVFRRAVLRYSQGSLDSLRAIMEPLVRHPQPTPRSGALRMLRFADLVEGRVRDAERHLREWWAVNAARGAPQPAVRQALQLAWIDIWVRERPEEAVARMEAALRDGSLASLDVEDRPYLEAVELFASAGRVDRAREVMAQYDREVRDTALKRFQLPERHRALATIALAENRHDDAIADFRKADLRPDGPADDCSICSFIALALAYDNAGRRDSAIDMYERYLTTPMTFRVEFDALYRAAVHRRLGELYEDKGDVPKAISQLNQFVQLWRNADPELQPRVADARRRIERLSRIEP